MYIVQNKFAGHWSAVFSGVRLFLAIVFYLVLTRMYAIHFYESCAELVTWTKTEMFNKEKLKQKNMEKENVNNLEICAMYNPTKIVRHKNIF